MATVITNEQEYNHCKAQVQRQQEELGRMELAYNEIKNAMEEVESACVVWEESHPPETEEAKED